MRLIKALLLITCVILLAGCWTLSLHPLYTDQDLVFDPQLVGAWGDTTKSHDDTWIFQQGENKTYRLLTKEENEPDGLFAAHLVQLGEHRFLDIFPEEPARENEFFRSHLIPAHTFWKINIEGHVMTLSPFNNEWLNEGLENKTINLAHIREDEVIIFTASTAELQEFILQHVDVAFEDDPFVLYHKKW
ncbi:hypothetical protein ACFLQW_00575 [Candidatus Zixiibacteriota bacterium]